MTEQLPIDFEAPRAAKADPWTSHAAAKDATLKASAGRMAALACLMRKPMNDFQMAEATGLQQTSIGKRRLECQRAGLVQPLLNRLGKQEATRAPSGSRSLVWQITEAGAAFYRAAKLEEE